MKRRVAIIDMGTNTFHLLIADVEDGGYSIICREKVPVKIGKGGINKGMITDEGKERALKALLYFKNELATLNCNVISAFGTSALRSAKNGKEVIDEMRLRTGIDVKIISGGEEAELIYKGVRAAVKLGLEKSLIIDIGGGSVEFMIANENEIFWKQSLEIGAQRLLEKFHRHDPMEENEIRELDDFLKNELQPVFTKLAEHRPKVMVGSSGTFDTLSEIYCVRNNISYSLDHPETPLTFQSFHEVYEELIRKDRAARLQIPGMIEMRVDMIVVACCLIRYLIENYSFEKIRVSTYSLKEGALALVVE
jgi:exopolyphosphatase/guanosine-5'-triphosphate,3'-diphosphate pyrophosphatase